MADIDAQFQLAREPREGHDWGHDGHGNLLAAMRPGRGAWGFIGEVRVAQALESGHVLEAPCQGNLTTTMKKTRISKTLVEHRFTSRGERIKERIQAGRAVTQAAAALCGISAHGGFLPATAAHQPLGLRRGKHLPQRSPAGHRP
ncbi:hypothetical protein ACU4GH_15390 [Bradyrhizobium betae]